MFQNIKNISKSEGVLALWKGLPPTLLGIIHPLVFFPMYEKMKISLKQKYEPNADHLSSKYIMLSSIISKLGASAVSYPHEVLRSRI